MFLTATLIALFALSACGADDPAEPATGQGAQAPVTGDPATTSTLSSNPLLSQHGLDDNLRFVEPRTISVAMWNRSHERIPNFSESYWAEWIEAQMLEEHNIIVEWIQVPRWEDAEYMSALLAGGMAPDISYTFNNPMVDTFAAMGGVMNLSPLLADYRDLLLPNLYDLLTETNVYWNVDPETNNLFSLTGRLITDGRINTFVREDWLDTLNIAPPTTLEQFEDMLVAFRDNADTLLGAADANRMIPFLLGHDVSWTGDPILTSFIPHNITEREWFVYGFDDRRFTQPGIKEGVRVLNRWFDMDLLWNDFFLHPAGDPITDDQKKLGFVGAFSHNWDYPFRASESIIVDMRDNVGEHANFMVVTPFQNDAGVVRKQMPNPTDRFIFFPTTNTEPIASLIYLDWISRADVREFLQFGHEGVHRRTHPNGAIEVLGETETHSWPDHQFIPSLRNFDILITVNGIDLGDDYITAATLALGYPGIAPEQVMAARAAGMDNAWVARRVVHPPIIAEEGLATPLQDQRDVILHQVIAATSPADFDATWDTMMASYMNMGAQAIINERNQFWLNTFGDVDSMP